MNKMIAPEVTDAFVGMLDTFNLYSEKLEVKSFSWLFYGGFLVVPAVNYAVLLLAKNTLSSNGLLQPINQYLIPTNLGLVLLGGLTILLSGSFLQVPVTTLDFVLSFFSYLAMIPGAALISPALPYIFLEGAGSYYTTAFKMFVIVGGFVALAASYFMTFYETYLQGILVKSDSSLWWWSKNGFYLGSIGVQTFAWWAGMFISMLLISIASVGGDAIICSSMLTIMSVTSYIMIVEPSNIAYLDFLTTV